MNKINRFFTYLCTIAALTTIGSAMYAQEQISLHIGDPAPELKYSKWIKGQPVDIKGNQIYVLECWATWCTPCIAAMPHLTELSKKYAGKAVFIGCNVWEQKRDRDKNKVYDRYLPLIENFVNLNKDRMGYHVIADNNAQDISNSWLKASGQYGIPSTFVVKSNQIMWIGHPSELDSILAGLVNGTYDISGARKVYDERYAAAIGTFEAIKKMNKELQDAVAIKDFQRAYLIVEESRHKEPSAEVQLKVEWFEILRTNFDETKAINYLREQHAKGDQIGMAVASVIAKRVAVSEGYLKESYFYAAEILQENSPDCLTLDKAAQALKRGGNVKAAVIVQKKALALARTQSRDPNFAGRVFDSTVTDFQSKLAAYQKFDME